MFIDQGCTEAWRTDGGGSNIVKIKKANTTSLSNYIYPDNDGPRYLWNTLYWSEL